LDLSLSPHHAAFRAQIKEFLDQHAHVAPRPGDLDYKSPDRLRWQKLLIENGYAARTIPSAYGGFGAKPDLLESHIIAEEFARSPLPGGIAGQGISMLVPTLLELGTQAQRQRYVKPTLLGEMVWCQGYSEPNSGSDLASLRTAAYIDGDDYVINGQKIWTSTAQHADMMFCLVRTEAQAPKHQGISYLLVPMSAPGIDVRPLKTMVGTATFNEVFFTDVRISRDQIIGQPGEGWSVANATLTHERGMLGDPDAGLKRLNKIVELMQVEAVDGYRLMSNPVLRDRLVKLQAEVHAMRYNGLRLMTQKLHGQRGGIERLIVKLQGCELNHQLAALAIDVMGEFGLLYGEDSPYLRDRGSWQFKYMFDLGLIIGGGTAQIQKNIIAERGLGLPREPKLVTTKPTAT
jgi:alkylation response protein AidB-like acyl-CoA dehydrogenase